LIVFVFLLVFRYWTVSSRVGQWIATDEQQGNVTADPMDIFSHATADWQGQRLGGLQRIHSTSYLKLGSQRCHHYPCSDVPLCSQSSCQKTSHGLRERERRISYGEATPMPAYLYSLSHVYLRKTHTFETPHLCSIISPLQLHREPSVGGFQIRATKRHGCCLRLRIFRTFQRYRARIVQAVEVKSPWRHANIFT